MSSQPIPKIVRDNNVIEEKPIFTLLIDSNSLLEHCFHGCKKLNSKGEEYGAIFQFILQLKILISKKAFDRIICVWDGDLGGALRTAYLPEYKANRLKDFNIEEVRSEYYDKMDAFIKKTLEYSRKNKDKIQAKLSEKEDFHRQRNILMSYLEELFITQIPPCDKMEADDILSYYVWHRQKNEKIYVVSGDLDLMQLLVEDEVAIYVPRNKAFVSTKTFKSTYNYDYRNVLLIKQFCGDTSDNIKGIKQLGSDTLLKIMPEIVDRPVKLYEVLTRVKELKQQRIVEKKKPLMVYENILNQKSDGMHDGNVYEINDIVMNLKKPLLTEEALTLLTDMMHVPIDPEGRSLANLYKLMIRDGIDELLNENKFANFFSTFSQLRTNETKFYEKWVKENN